MKEINWKEMQINPSMLFGNDWMALAAGNRERGYNAMTVAWGHLGTIWELNSHANHLPTAAVYVRPSRYTKQFMDREKVFTLSRVPRKAHGILGSKSGRDMDKIAEAGLTPVFSDDTVWFEEADLVLVCRKLYQSTLAEEGFVDRNIVEFNYPERDFHTMYIGEIIRVLQK